MGLTSSRQMFQKLTPPRVVFISAFIGNYEKTPKPHAPQSIPCDWVLFSNTGSQNKIVNGWEIDTHPYHDTHRPSFWTLDKFNGASRHPFFLAKYYKQCAWCIPRLAKYDVIVWLDGTIEITNPDAAKILVQKIDQGHSIVGWQHDYVPTMEKEARLSSMLPRYMSSMYLGHQQSPQKIPEQLEAYLSEGFEQSPQHWVTCLVAFDTRAPTYLLVLQLWFVQTLLWSTEDQVSFPYVCWKAGVRPYTFPDGDLSGKGHSITDLYIKHNHGK